MEKYEIINVLGEGSFGRVYKAKSIADCKVVAFKVISKARRSSKEIIGLRRECEIQRHLHHPNIIQMLDSFETQNEIVVVTEFAHTDLTTVLAKCGYLHEPQAYPIVCDLLAALNYLHASRVLHRDLKPQNILLDAGDRAKLCDFGFARTMSAGTHVLTSIKGTPLYMAPELIAERPYDFKADLWSLGCIVYEMLVGRPPFSTFSILNLIRLIQSEAVQWPTFVSPECVAFLQGLLQKDPALRSDWPTLLAHPFVVGRVGAGAAPRARRPMEPSAAEVDEWLVFLQRTMEEVLAGELGSLAQPNLVALVLTPVRGASVSARVLAAVARLLSLPFAAGGGGAERVRRAYVEVRIVASLVGAASLVTRAEEGATERFCELGEEEFDCLEAVYVLVTHLVHLGNEFLAQFCDLLDCANVANVLRFYLQVGKNRLQLPIDILSVLTHVLRHFPEKVDRIERIVTEQNGENVNFVEMLRNDDDTLKERACLFLLFLGKHLASNKMEFLWNESVRETLEALMYDSMESVRSAADRAVEELRTKDFYNK